MPLTVLVGDPALVSLDMPLLTAALAPLLTDKHISKRMDSVLVSMTNLPSIVSMCSYRLLLYIAITCCELLRNMHRTCQQRGL